MKYFSFILILFCLSKHQGFTQTLLFGKEPRIVKVSTKNKNVFRITLSGDSLCYSTLDNVYPLKDSDKYKPIDFSMDSTHFIANINGFNLRLRHNTLIISLEGTQKIIQEFQFDKENVQVFFRPGDKGLFGLGQEGMSYNRDKSYIKMNAGTFEGEIELYGSRVPIPFLISPEGWGLYIRQPYYPAFDLRNSKSSFLLSDSSNQNLDFFLILDPDPKVIVSEYYKLTGLSPMPPKWSMGYMQSHRTLSGPDEIEQVAVNLREKNLPCDALIYLGTGYTPSGWNLGHGSFSFNPAVFSHPKKQMNQLDSMHYKIILHTLRPPEELYGSFSDTDVSENDSSHLKNYWKKHQPLMKLGVDGFWPDMGDHLSVDAKLARHRMYYEGSILENPNQRPFALHRTGYPGMQQYGGWVWSGDVYSTWETLKEQIALGINWSLSGSAYWGTDIGGFVSTPEYSGELYVRWFQFASFCPSFRSHGRNWHLHTPWGWNTGTIGHVENKKDTKGIGLPADKELRNEQVEPVCRKYLQLRYQLLPYNYTLSWQTHKQGLPMMRAMWLYYPDNEKAINTDDQYFWGEYFLVAPVYEKNATNRNVYLPKGEWYDYWTNRIYVGDQTINRFIGLEDMPLYVKAGAIIPLAPVRQYFNQPVQEPLQLNVYTGKDGNFQLYEDDGETQGYIHGNYLLTNFQWNDKFQTLTITPGSVNAEFSKTAQPIKVVLIPGMEEKEILYQYGTQTIQF